MVLGTHRSGTSVLTSCPGRAGVHLGAVLDQPHPLHGRGVHEPLALVLMHEGSLNRIAPWSTLWGFKDPTLLLCL